MGTKFNPNLSLDQQTAKPIKPGESWQWMKEHPEQAQATATQYRRELIEQIKAKLFFWRKR